MDNIKLQQFTQYAAAKELQPGYGDDYIFFVGEDDVHNIILTLINQEKVELDFNMYGFADDELNQAILTKIKTPSVLVKGTLDKSQAGGVHEKQLLSADETNDPAFLNSIAIGESATHQISHTKGMVFVGQGLWFHGSTNFSKAGEGIGISLKIGAPQPAGFVAQNNTLSVSGNLVNLGRFKNRLAREHLIAVNQGGKV